MFLDDIFETPANNMCEGIVSGSPEYFSCVTSIFMLLFGILGLFFSNNPPHLILIKFVHALLLLNGIASFGHHLTMTVGWKILDEITIFSALMITSYQFINEIIHKMYKKVHHESVFFYPSIIQFVRLKIITGIMMLVFVSSSLMGLMMSLNRTNSDQWVDPILFGVPLCIISICYFIMRHITHQPSRSELNVIHMFNNAQIFHAYSVLSIGIVMCVVLTSIDQLVEIYCPRYRWFGYLGIHGLWHIAISIGLYMITQFLVFISMIGDDQISGNFISYRYRHDRCNSFLNTVVPIITYDEI
jgi:hypothetical protein